MGERGGKCHGRETAVISEIVERGQDEYRQKARPDENEQSDACFVENLQTKSNLKNTVEECFQKFTTVPIPDDI